MIIGNTRVIINIKDNTLTTDKCPKWYIYTERINYITSIKYTYRYNSEWKIIYIAFTSKHKLVITHTCYKYTTQERTYICFKFKQNTSMNHMQISNDSKEQTNRDSFTYLNPKFKINISKVINTYAITVPIYRTPEKNTKINYTDIKNTNNNTKTFKKCKE